MAFPWCDLLAAVTATPPPRYTAGTKPTTAAFDGTPTLTGGPVRDLVYDAETDRMLFATAGGQIGFLNLNDGQSGVLVDVPGSPPLLQLHLSRDHAALCVIGHPHTRDRPRQKDRPFVQIWNYTVLRDRLTQPPAALERS